MKTAIKSTLLAFIFAGSLPFSMAHATQDDHKGEVVVFKTPWCGCCQVWVDALKKAGYRVESNDLEDLTAIRKQAGVPDDMQGCHTAVVGDERKYVLEGHVPLEAIEKVLAETPDVRGIAVPGMPMGSLGMGNDPHAQYDVYAYSSDAEPTIFYKAGQ